MMCLSIQSTPVWQEFWLFFNYGTFKVWQVSFKNRGNANETILDETLFRDYINHQYIFRFRLVSRARRGVGVPLCTCVIVNANGCGFDPHSRIWYIYLNLYFYFFALASGQSAALSFAIQYAISPYLAENEEAGSCLCLPSRVRDTNAWSWSFSIFFSGFISFYNFTRHNEFTIWFHIFRRSL